MRYWAFSRHVFITSMGDVSIFQYITVSEHCFIANVSLASAFYGVELSVNVLAS